MTEIKLHSTEFILVVIIFLFGAILFWYSLCFTDWLAMNVTSMMTVWVAVRVLQVSSHPSSAPLRLHQGHSAAAFCSPFSAIPLLQYLISSTNDCFSIWKLWRPAVSVLRASSNCMRAFPKRSWSVSTDTAFSLSSLRSSCIAQNSFLWLSTFCSEQYSFDIACASQIG